MIFVGSLSIAWIAFQLFCRLSVRHRCLRRLKREKPTLISTGSDTAGAIEAQESVPRAPVIKDSVRAFGGQKLELRWASPGTCVLQDLRGQTTGVLVSPFGSTTEAHAAEGVWRLAVVRSRFGWGAEAQESPNGDTVARYSPSGLPGGRIWLAPEGRYSLRQAPWTARWSLRASRRRRVACLRGLTRNRVDVEVDQLSGTNPSLSLLILFASWLVVLEGRMHVVAVGGTGG